MSGPQSRMELLGVDSSALLETEPRFFGDTARGRVTVPTEQSPLSQL
jgi:hypothetical protein